MKTKQVLIIAVIVTTACFTQKANAKIWRVNNQSNYNGSTSYSANFGLILTLHFFQHWHLPNVRYENSQSSVLPNLKVLV
jgi:hypothetical protein